METLKRNLSLSGIALLLAVWVFCPALRAQEAVEEAEKPLSEIELRLKKKVTVDFRDTPIDDVILVMSKQADVDVVKSPDVIGNITATLTDVPLDEALRNILSAHGYAYVTSESMIRIILASELAIEEDKMVSKVFRITYASVDDVYESVVSFLSENGTSAMNAGTSNIIVTDTETKMRAIEDFISEVDRITPQMMIEVRIYDVSAKDRLDVGFQYFAGSATTYSSSGLPIGGETNPFSSGNFDASTSFTETAAAALRFGILNDSLDLDIIFRAEQEEITAKLLANPRIMVLDNETATIKIISEVPYQELTQTSGGDNIGTTEFKEIGVSMDVTPHLTRDGMIRLHLRPTFSVQTGEVAISFAGGFGGITSPQPIVDSREIDTRLLVQDGQTVVLGGLRKRDSTSQVNKIPILGDIPLVGGLFRFEGEEIVVSELLVFVTPHLLDEFVLSSHEAKSLEDTFVEMPELEDSTWNKRNVPPFYLERAE